MAPRAPGRLAARPALHAATLPARAAALPQDWGAVLDSPLPLKVVASSLDSLSPVLLEGFACKQDLAESLKASATVPEIAGGPRLHR